MFNGKKKAVTFSFDDGVTQDERLIAIFNKYGLLATFNLNSDLLGKEGQLVREGVTVSHNKNKPEEIARIYKGHEVASHTRTHPLLCGKPDDFIVSQVEEDRKNLSRLCGYEVVGFAYPCGGVNYDEHAATVIREQTGIQYARTIECTDDFDLPTNLFTFKPTVYHMDFERMTELGERFLSLSPNTPKLFYIWGHAYEFDIHNTWDAFEAFCKRISGRDDIFYGTNKQVFSCLPGNN